MVNFCSKFLLLIITLISVGAIAAISIWALVLVIKFKITQISGDKALIAVTIIIVIVVVAILIFNFYASFAKNRCVSFSQTITFSVLLAACIFLMVASLIYKSKVFDKFGKYWDDCQSKNDSSVCTAISSVEEKLGCHTWNGNITEKPTCKSKIEDPFVKNIIWVVVCLGVISLILIAGVILSCMKMCKPADDSESAKAQAEQPLSYGW